MSVSSNFFFSVKTLKHVLAFCLRFICNLRNKSRHSGRLSEIELEHSNQTIIKLTQRSAYSKEIHDLSNGRNVNSISDLLSLNPFLEKGILKVGGRLENSKILETKTSHSFTTKPSYYKVNYSRGTPK